MEYLELRKALGAEVAGRLEDAVLTALSSTKSSETEGRALRGVMIALVGAVIWARPDLGSTAAAERQCANDLASALQSLERSSKQDSSRQVN